MSKPLKKKEIGVKEKVQRLIGLNFDAKQYFYAKADERWLVWLWQNGFLEPIKNKAPEPEQYLVRIPELEYLVRMAVKKPKEVTDIILETPISDESFNPATVGSFLWITASLPAEEIGRLAEKIKSENWPILMWRYNRWGFEYSKILEKLFETKDYKNLLKIIEAVLQIKSPEDVKKAESKYSFENPFYFSDFSHTKIFYYFANIGDEYAESALSLCSKIMATIIERAQKTDENSVFEKPDAFYLYDVDFFNLQIGDELHTSFRDDVKQLAAVLKILSERVVKSHCNNPTEVTKLYKKYIDKLPSSRSMWRLRLFVMSLCPNAFEVDLKEAFFEIFREDNRPWELVNGAEYENSLKAAFWVLEDDDKRIYILKALEYFSGDGKDNPDLWKRTGWSILSCILSELTDTEKEKAEKIFGNKLDGTYMPQPSVIMGEFAKRIIPKAPVTLDEIGKMSVKEISEALQTRWGPESLEKLNTGDDFYNPLNAEGLAEELKPDIEKRFQEYIDNATLFFERDKLDQHYTYSFLKTVYDSIHSKKIPPSIKWDGLLQMFSSIVDSGSKDPFGVTKRRREAGHSWLANWAAVHSTIADILQELLRDNEPQLIEFEKNKEVIFAIITYLFTYPDPLPKDETPERGDIYTIAINSVRGRVFEAFLQYLFQDTKTFPKDSKIKISVDAKKLYEDVLNKEETQSIMFMFGHYIPFFFYRDEGWVINLTKKIFPKEKKDLYLASMQGYLAANLYKEVFEKLTNTYEDVVTLKLSENLKTKRTSFKDIDESLPGHIALAYIHFENFNSESHLFKSFWENNNPLRHKAFISFVGRHAISRDTTEKPSESSIDKIKILWDWLLSNVKDVSAFEGFGFWINLEKNIFDLKWLSEHVKKTLEKTKGNIEWEYGLMKSLPKLAEKEPENTLEIIKLYLQDIEKFGIQHHASIYVDTEIFESLKILYAQANTKKGVYDLINRLLPLGGGRFWKLKEVITNQ